MADDPFSTVEAYIAAFNALDEEGLAGCFADPGFILDGMAPHVWAGSAATRDWFRDALAEFDHTGASDFVITLAAPTHNAVSGEAAYVVVPATMAFQVGGQRLTQTGARFTVALRRVEGAWRIAAWAWTKGAGAGTAEAARPG